MNKRILVFVLCLIVLSSCALITKKKGIELPVELRQWADTAQASSSSAGKYGGNIDDQSATAATGAPNVDTCMDDMKAWATQKADDGDQWIELKYYDEVHVSKVRIRETLAPGAIKKIELKDKDKYMTLWEGIDDRRHKDCPGFFEKSYSVKEGNFTLNMTSFKTDTVRVTLNTNIPEWNEIDAVELIGYTNKWYYYNNTLRIE